MVESFNNSYLEDVAGGAGNRVKQMLLLMFVSCSHLY